MQPETMTSLADTPSILIGVFLLGLLALKRLKSYRFNVVRSRSPCHSFLTNGFFHQLLWIPNVEQSAHGFSIELASQAHPSVTH